MQGLSLATTLSYHLGVMTVPTLDVFAEMVMALKDGQLAKIEMSVEKGILGQMDRELCSHMVRALKTEGVVELVY